MTWFMPRGHYDLVYVEHYDFSSQASSLFNNKEKKYILFKNLSVQTKI